MNPIVDVGPYRFCFENCPSFIVDYLVDMYDESVNYSVDAPVDFTLTIKYTSFWRRFVKPQVCIYVDNQRPFNPVNPKLLMPSIEWGMNWCIASLDYSKLLIHSSVLVKNGKAIIFPATPGSGKSTLATHFGLHGWELFSDEMAIIPLGTNSVQPMHRAASLKNRSIDVIKQSSPNATFSPTTIGTHKGDIAHVKLHSRAEFELLKKATIVAVVFPKYKAENDLVVEQVSQVEGFAKLIHHSFNYSVLGESGFSTLQKVVENSDFYTASYSSYEGLEKFLLSVIET
ncbi:MAG: HprK-related kinase A [Glaciecola sp.]